MTWKINWNSWKETKSEILLNCQNIANKLGANGSSRQSVTQITLLNDITLDLLPKIKLRKNALIIKRHVLLFLIKPPVWQRLKLADYENNQIIGGKFCLAKIIFCNLITISMDYRIQPEMDCGDCKISHSPDHNLDLALPFVQ